MNLLGPGTLVKCNALKLYAYRTRAIIIPRFVQKRFFKVFFLKTMALCMVNIQERFLSRLGYSGARMVYIFGGYFLTFQSSKYSVSTMHFILMFLNIGHWVRDL